MKEINDLAKSIKPTRNLLKSQVKGHLRRTKAGQIIQVKEHLRKPAPGRSKDEAESPGRNFQYKVTREFTGGPLKGLVHTEITPVAMTEGREVKKPVGGSPYKIIKVEKVPVQPKGDKKIPFSLADKATGSHRYYDHDSGEEIHGYEGPFHPNGDKSVVLHTWKGENGERHFSAFSRETSNNK